MSAPASYYVPAQSRWPIYASISLFLLAFGAACGMAASSESAMGQWGLVLFAIGLVCMLMVVMGWFASVISEDAQGLYSPQMDRSFRWAMGWFIFSEIMFFAAFFGTLFYLRVLAVPWLGGEGEKGVSQMLWPSFEASWPLMTTPDPELFPGPKALVDPWHIPLLNTVLLVASSVTVTLAHRALKLDQRPALSLWLALTVVLGLVFLFFQAVEYHQAYTQLGLTLQAGVYGSTFFILTGFHGVHVTLGTLMLLVILIRVLLGHFGRRRHFGFEAVSWYWHFVDVVWLGLFLFVYIL